MDCYIGLGTNVGDLAENLERALAALERRALVPRDLSSVWETEPVGTDDPRWFWNMVARLDGRIPPRELLDTLLAIEQEAGRRRGERNAPRTLDLDLLMVGDQEIDEPGLKLPHPRMWSRRFVIEPLAEIAPRLRNPATGRSISEERRRLRETTKARRIGRLACCPTRHL